MEKLKTPTLARELGAALRRFREAHGLRQDDIAACARTWGIRWSRPAVAAIEAGQRRLTIEQLFLLPWIATNQDRKAAKRGEIPVWPLGAMLEELGLVRLSPAVQVGGRGLRLIVEGRAVEAAEMFETPADRARWDANWDLARQIFPSAGEAPEATWQVNVAAQGEAEQKAAARFKTSPLAVARVARKLWGCSFTAERDRRVAERHTTDKSPRTIQALRGHVARELIEELRRAGLKRWTSKRPAAPGRPRTSSRKERKRT
jgi:transcriptional regulator with XRE-family HTH domain